MTHIAAVSGRRTIALPAAIPAPQFQLWQRVWVFGAHHRYPATLCGMTWNSEEGCWLYAIGDGSRLVTEDCLTAES